MNTDNILSLIAISLSVISAVYSVCIHRRECNRVRKQATLDAFNSLQEQVLDELSQSRPADINDISGNRRKKEVKPKYDHLRTLVARIEHFAIGIDEGIYDYETVDKLAAEHLIYLYRKLSPIIQATRESASGENTYTHFEWLFQELIQHHPEIGRKPYSSENKEAHHV